MLIGYGALNVVVLMVRIGSARCTTDSSGSVASIGHVVSRAPSDSFRPFGAGVVNTSPLLAAPPERLCPLPMTPNQMPLQLPSFGPPSGLLLPPPPQLARPSAR